MQSNNFSPLFRKITVSLVSFILVTMINGCGGARSPSANGMDDSTSNEGTNDAQIIISWNQNPNPVIGYKIFHGSSPESASTLLSDILVTSKNFIPETPSVTFNAINELNLKVGDSICFSIKAYNMIGMSDFSSAKCVTI